MGAIRLSLLLMLAANPWAALHSLLAARTLARDLDRTAERDREGGFSIA